jgi:hypothetical protein
MCLRTAALAMAGTDDMGEPDWADDHDVASVFIIAAAFGHLVPRQATFALLPAGTSGTRHRVRLAGIMRGVENVLAATVRRKCGAKTSVGGRDYEWRSRCAVTDRKCRFRTVPYMLGARDYGAGSGPLRAHDYA